MDFMHFFRGYINTFDRDNNPYKKYIVGIKRNNKHYEIWYESDGSDHYCNFDIGLRVEDYTLISSVEFGNRVREAVKKKEEK